MAEEFLSESETDNAFLLTWKFVPVEEMQQLSGKIRVALGVGMGYDFYLYPESGHFTWGNSSLLQKNVERRNVDLKDDATALAAAINFMQSRNELLGPLGKSFASGKSGQNA